jgi:hypothetical protein
MKTSKVESTPLIRYRKLIHLDPGGNFNGRQGFFIYFRVGV